MNWQSTYNVSNPADPKTAIRFSVDLFEALEQLFSIAVLLISACPKSIFFNAGNSFSLFTDVKIYEKEIYEC